MPEDQEESSPRTDEVLIVLAALEDKSSFAELYERHGSRVIATIRRKIQNPADQEDLAQEVWMKVWRYRVSIAASGNFLAALYRITRTTIIDYLHGHGINVAVLDADATPADAQQTVVERAPDPSSDFSLCDWSGIPISDLSDCLHRLPAESRTAVLLIEVVRMEPQEAADLLGVGYGMVWRRHHIGIRSIQWCLKAKGYHFGPTNIQVIEGTDRFEVDLIDRRSKNRRGTGSFDLVVWTRGLKLKGAKIRVVLVSVQGSPAVEVGLNFETFKLEGLLCERSLFGDCVMTAKDFPGIAGAGPVIHVSVELRI